jgi:hypothetical protein
VGRAVRAERGRPMARSGALFGEVIPSCIVPPFAQPRPPRGARGIHPSFRGQAGPPLSRESTRVYSASRQLDCLTPMR